MLREVNLKTEEAFKIIYYELMIILNYLLY